MKIEKFIELIKSGFDVSFNYNEVYYTISMIDEKDNVKFYGIGSDNGFMADFNSIDDIPRFIIDNKTISENVENISEDELDY